MGLGKKTIDDENYAGKRVLVRCDFTILVQNLGTTINGNNPIVTVQILTFTSIRQLQAMGS